MNHYLTDSFTFVGMFTVGLELIDWLIYFVRKLGA